jgi:hypothetical protein
MRRGDNVAGKLSPLPALPLTTAQKVLLSSSTTFTDSETTNKLLLLHALILEFLNSLS